ncbi:MAG: sugar kinase [Bacteroidales bacterium]|nr:sugar kinase [Bacteroidales bacterium]
MHKKIVTFGEIMLRLATPEHQRFSQATSFWASFGGGEANVAVSLANYGLKTEFVTRLPDNDVGRSVIMELRKHNVGTGSIIFGGERLGIYFLETGSVSRPSKVIYDRAHSSVSEIRPGMIDWEKVFTDACWFHWTGITPAISQGAADACLEAIKAAKKLGLTVSCDLNFRKNLWKWGSAAKLVMPAMVELCDVILGNEEDAEKVFGIKPEGTDVSSGKVDSSEYESVCRQLKNRFPGAEKIIITLRGSVSADHNSWSGILYNGKDFFNAPVYQITHIVDRVGGGDSFMGGLIYGLLNYPGDDQKALNFAVAASCLKHTIHGDFNLVTISEVEQLMKGDASGRVVR